MYLFHLVERLGHRGQMQLDLIVYSIGKQKELQKLTFSKFLY